MLSNKKIGGILIFFIVLAFGVSVYLQAGIGMADSGDFSRVMLFYTSRPAGFAVNWPPPNTKEYGERFFNYFLPYWKLDFPLTPYIFSSVLVLWLPGVLLNYLVFSRSILSITFISLTPVVFILCFLFALMRWINRSFDGMQNLLFLTFGVPLVLMLSDSNYLSFFKSFYQETASIVFTIAALFIIGQGYSRTRITTFFSIIAFFGIFLLATAKESTLYLPLIVFPFLLFLHKDIWNKSYKIVLAIMAFVVFPVAFSFIFCGAPYMKNTHNYQRIFTGALAFSTSPQTHLRRLGINNGLQRINKDAYAKGSREFIVKNEKFLSYESFVNIIIHEPMIAVRMIDYAANHMQVISTPLKKRADYKRKMNAVSGFDYWTRLKYHLFPRGRALFLCLLIMAVACTISPLVRGRGRAVTALGMVGLFSCIGCFADFSVAIFGDGKADLIKHLLLSNFFFDVSVIIFANMVIIYIFKELIGGRRGLLHHERGQ